jgi:phage minor structural protein
MTLIHITDQQTDTILDTISDFWDDTHKKQLDHLEIFDFVTFADQRYSQHLRDRNRVIIPAEDGGYIEFIIEETVQRLDRTKAVYCTASYLELKKQKVIRPQTLSGQTAQTAVTFALSGTEWQPGNITFAGIRTIHIEEHTNPYSLLKRIASEFNLELNFRVEIDHNRVVARYVDLVERVGSWQGREITFGKDLLGIERKEKTDQIVTALVGIGPEREDGTRLEVFVEDLDALQRWGRNGKHLVEVYEPQSTDQDMTESRLRTLTENELEKRINAIVEYEIDVVDLENVPGMENKKIRFGDTLRIKDEGFSPPLYIEARVHTQERSIKDKSRKKIILGDFIEYTEEDVKAIWKALQAEIAKKVSMSQVMEVTYDKQTIDQKDQLVYQDSTYYADIQAQPGKEAKQKIDTDVGTGTIETTSGAQQKADQAEQNAKSYAEQRVQEAEQEIEAAKQRLGEAENRITQAEQDIVQAEIRLDNLDQELSSLDMQKISEGIFALEGGSLYLEGTLYTRSGGVFDGDIIARNMTLAGDITAQNAVITGTITGSGATFQRVDIANANIINANIQNATITGRLNGVDGTFVGQLVAASGTFEGHIRTRHLEIGDPFEEWSNYAIRLAAGWSPSLGTRWVEFVSDSLINLTIQRYETASNNITLNNFTVRANNSLITGNLDIGGNLDLAGSNGIRTRRVRGYFDSNIILFGSSDRMMLTETDSYPHYGLILGRVMVKGLNSSAETVQIRDRGDTAYRNIQASDFVVSSREEYKEDIEELTGRLLDDVVGKTHIYSYRFKDREERHLGVIYEESPEMIRHGEDGISLESQIAVLWKALQEVRDELELSWEAVQELVRRVQNATSAS